MQFNLAVWLRVVMSVQETECITEHKSTGVLLPLAALVQSWPGAVWESGGVSWEGQGGFSNSESLFPLCKAAVRRKQSRQTCCGLL